MNSEEQKTINIADNDKNEIEMIAGQIVSLTNQVCLSVEDVARITTFSPSLVKQKMNEGSMPGFRSNKVEARGSRWAVSALDLAKWIHNQGEMPESGDSA